MDFTRRDFVKRGTMSIAAFGSVGEVDVPEPQQVSGQNSTAYQEVLVLAGDESARPTQSQLENVPNGERTYYAVVYEAVDTGATFYIDQDINSWQTLAVHASRLSLVGMDLSTVSASDGEIYRHDGSSSITANGTSTTSQGYYCWSATDSEWKSVVNF